MAGFFPQFFLTAWQQELLGAENTDSYACNPVCATDRHTNRLTD